MSVAEVAETLGLDESVVGMAVASVTTPAAEVTVEELVAKYRPQAIKVLADIMEHGENESARVKAAQILVEGKGQLPEVNSEKYAKAFDAMKKVLSKYTKEPPTKVIDIPAGEDMRVVTA